MKLNLILALLTVHAVLTAQVPVPEEVPKSDDLALYAHHCSPCHGARGRGDGPAGRFLDPKPRDFGAGTFKIVSGVRGGLLDGDLERTIRDGMPGSAMLSFAHLGEGKIRGLVGVVRSFQRHSIASRLAGAARDREQLDRWIAEELAPQRPYMPKAIGNPENAAIQAARGRLTYLRACARCHGDDGRARMPPPLLPEDGPPFVARDLTSGVFRGGRSKVDLARRIRFGMPGTAMPATSGRELNDGELQDLLVFLETLIPKGPDKVHSLEPPILYARKIEGPCPQSPDDPRLVGLPEYRVPVVPFRQGQAPTREILVQAATDGEFAIFRVRYGDSRADGASSHPQASTDGVAARITQMAEPPVLPTPGQPLPLDRALWLSDAGPLVDDPGSVGSPAEFENPDNVCKSPVGPERIGAGSWKLGQWTVVLPVSTERAGAVAAGGQHSVSFSIFDRLHSEGPMPVAFSPWCTVHWP